LHCPSSGDRTWDFQDEPVSVSALIDVVNDAWLAAAKGLPPGSGEGGLGFPYATRYLRAADAESVCTFDAALKGIPYEEVHGECSDYLPSQDEE